MQSPPTVQTDENSPQPAKPRREFLERLEIASRIFAALAIPVIVAVGGWFIQNATSRQSLSKDYVNLALTILQRTEAEIEPGLRRWAVDLLNENSPTRLPSETLNELRTGKISLSAALGAIREVSSVVGRNGQFGFALSPDGKSMAVSGESKTIDLYDIATGQRSATFLGHTAEVLALVFVPDGSRLFSGGWDNTVRVWDLPTGRTLATLELDDGILGLGISADSQFLVARLRNELRVFTIDSLNLVRTVKLKS